MRICSNGILTHFVLAFLLGALVIAAPVVNASARLPRSVFLVLPKTAPPPEVSFTVRKLDRGRVRLFIETSGFQFSALCVTTADAQPLGHAHVIVRGKKVASAYTPVVDLGPLPAGLHRVTVVLRGQDHRALVGPRGLIQFTQTVRIMPSGHGEPEAT